MNTKPLSEWTLGEVQKYCKITQCGDCCIGLWCENINKGPSNWDLSEPPRWTEQDKEDAMMIKRLIPWANQVNRGMEGSLSLNPVTAIDRKLFPLLKPGESAMLDEIIGGGE